MESKATIQSSPDEKTLGGPGNPPVQPPTSNVEQKDRVRKNKDYTSEGVTDNDIFLLPGSDLQILGLLTVIAAVVRLFRIYQPTSVVFDEVQ